MPRLRIATFNIFSGRPEDDERTDPEQLARAVELIDADVLGLQEVDRGQERSGWVDQAELVAKTLDASHWRFVPAMVGTPGESWRPAGPLDEEVDGRGAHGPAMYGVALVSRLPVLTWRVLRLRGAPVRAPIVVRDREGRRKLIRPSDEPRIAVAAVLDTDRGPLTVATTHLSFVPGWNVAQLRRLSSWLEALPSPQVLTGDLNVPGRLPRTVCRQWRPLVTAPTWPAGRPWTQLDHVLGRHGVPPVVGTGAPRLPLSDHRALWVDLQGSPAAEESRA